MKRRKRGAVCIKASHGTEQKRYKSDMQKNDKSLTKRQQCVFTISGHKCAKFDAHLGYFYNFIILINILPIKTIVNDFCTQKEVVCSLQQLAYFLVAAQPVSSLAIDTTIKPA